MSNHLELAQRQIEDRSELVKVRAQLAIDRKGVANLEEREAAIVARMSDRQTTINDLMEVDKLVGTGPLTPYGEQQALEAQARAESEPAF